MVRFNNLIFSLAAILIAGPATAIESTTIPREYTAVYKVIRNDKELAAVTIDLSQEEDTWRLHGFSHDTQGLAKLINFKGSQTATGKWQNGRFRPDNYTFSYSLIGIKNKWEAIFDWQTGVVETHSKRGENLLPMNGMANDPFSLSLNLRSQLAENLSEMPANVVDEDKIRNQIYRTEPQARIDTPLGCLDTTLVSRVRKNKKRTSLGWYAQDYHFIPVRLQHKVKKGSNLELMIVSLEIEGTPVQPNAPCI